MKSIRKIIREIIEEEVLNERLMGIEKDVDYIYDTYFKDDFDEVAKTGKIREIMFKVSVLSTSELTSELSREAHEKNPCLIIINKEGNYYHPSNEVISIGVNRQAIEFINSVGKGDIEEAASRLDERQANSLKNELKPSSIKGSIHHELVHWIDDTLHNRHINKMIKKAQETNSKTTGSDAWVKKFEIQSQIHNIKQLKNHYESEWDDLTFLQMIKKSPALSLIYNNLYGDKKDNWLKNLKKRMYREGLLGKRMFNN
jgi:vacuolar-type H+-ATPase subunit I/STV1